MSRYVELDNNGAVVRLSAREFPGCVERPEEMPVATGALRWWRHPDTGVWAERPEVDIGNLPEGTEVSAVRESDGALFAAMPTEPGVYGVEIIPPFPYLPADLIVTIE